MNCQNCSNDNDRDYPVCRTCEPSCHFTNPRRDCLCDSCREKRASEYPSLNLMAWEGDWPAPKVEREVLGAIEHEGELHIFVGQRAA
jgi:hypothetical protein